MGSYNIAEVEFDVKTGELNVSSRHRIDVKRQKVVGAVSILLVQSEDGSNPEAFSLTGTASKDGENRILKTSVLGSLASIFDPQGHSKVKVPSSLSLIDIPSPGVCNNGNLYHEKTQPEGVSNNSISPELSHSQALRTPSDVSNSLRRNEEESYSSDYNKSEKDLKTKSSNFRKGGTGPLCHKNTTDQPKDNLERILYERLQRQKELLDKKTIQEDKPRNVSVIDLTANVDAPQNKPHPMRSKVVHNPQHIEKRQMIQRLSDTKQPVGSGGLPYRINRHRRNAKIREVLRSGVTADPKCIVCGEKLSYFMQNKDHCDRHNMPRQCMVCGIKLSFSGNLKRHFSGHIHNVAFSCSFCPAMYRRKDNLSTHLVQKHNIYPWQRRSLGLQPKKPFLMNKLSRHGSLRTAISGSAVGLNRTSLPSADQGQYPHEEERSGSVAFPEFTSPNVPSMDASDQQYDSSVDQIAMETTEETDDRRVMLKMEDTNTDENKEGGDKSDKDIHIEIAQADDMEQSSLERKDSQESDASDQADAIDTSNAIINYSCSSCSVKFSELENLKKHVIQYHSEHVMTEEENPSDSRQGFTTAEPNGSHQTRDVESSRDTTIDLTSVDSAYMQMQTSRQHSPSFEDIVGHRSSSASFDLGGGDMSEVIDIEKLGEMSAANFLSLPKPHSDNSQNSQMFLLDDSYSGGKFTGDISAMYQNLSYQNNDSQMFSPDTPKKETDQNYAPHGRKKRIQKTGELLHCICCNVTFETWEQIIEHANMHPQFSGMRHGCVVCGTHFSSKDCLRRHAINHMGVRHSCLFCPTAYSRKDNLQKHMRDAHNYKK